MRSKRFEALAKRPVNQDGFVKEWPEEGLVAMYSPYDPKPSIRIENGVVVELDGKKREDFDFLDTFIADNSIELDRVQEVLAMDDLDIARKLVDFNVKRDQVLDITLSMTPAKMCSVLNKLTVLEMMMALTKMRARKMPANQCHVTNATDSPVLIAADAAEAAYRGFAEMESTTAVARYAPFNAMAIMVGGQVGRPGVLTQCSAEEATELRLGMKSITAYAETISVYGTEQVFIDGDDTPWSKAFLASSYASRGIKMRYTSGSGSEVLMGYAESKSMLYLESRCLFMTKGAGVQGIQNGSISCIGVPGAVPSGIREVLAENLLAALLDLENASGNDQTFSHSETRRTARTLLQMIPGTDYIFSGYSATPNYDNMFAGSNFDAEDFDDYNILQRDMKIDGGLRPVSEEGVIKVRNKAARAMQAVFKGLNFPAITDEEVEAATYAHGSHDIPKRNIPEDLKAADEFMKGKIDGVEIIKALYQEGFKDVADSMFQMVKLRVSGDQLQTAAILDENFKVQSAVNYPNDYHGPGTGYHMSQERWDEVKNIPNAVDATDFE
ncbi:propanediol dehydratase [Tissierellia bacterium S5-A11]|nr:propanediol dehydratase [Tissierellia bacterium S5-A11]